MATPTQPELLREFAEHIIAVYRDARKLASAIDLRFTGQEYLGVALSIASTGKAIDKRRTKALACLSALEEGSVLRAEARYILRDGIPSDPAIIRKNVENVIREYIEEQEG